jgi:hypothetical protein
MSTNSVRQSALCDRLISVLFEISWNSGLFAAVTPRVSAEFFTAAPQGDGVVVVRGRGQNSGYTDAISSGLPWLKVG